MVWSWHKSESKIEIQELQRTCEAQTIVSPRCSALHQLGASDTPSLWERPYTKNPVSREANTSIMKDPNLLGISCVVDMSLRLSKGSLSADLVDESRVSVSDGSWLSIICRVWLAIILIAIG
jgi:hypothetical protein